MAIRVLLLAAIVICLCACAEPKPRSVAEPNDKALCCQSLDQMKFAPLPLDYSNPTNVVMDQSSPLYAFESGKSYFAAVRLPPESQASDLEVITFANGGVVSESSAFYPKFLFLDAQYRIGRNLRTQGYRYEVNMMRGASWKTRVSPEPGDAYLVIYTSPAAFKYAFITPGTRASAIAVGSSLAFSPGGPGRYVGLGPTGDLSLRWRRRDPLRSTAGTGQAGLTPSRSDAATLSGSALQRSLIDWDGFQIVSVDGKRVDYGFTGDTFRMPVELPPGEHKVLVYFRTTKGYAMSELPDAYFRLAAQLDAGRSYRAVGTVDNYTVTAWIEDAQGRSRVSEQATASMYWQVPLTDSDAPSR